MKIEQIYTGCLSQGAYYIVSKDEAVIIDPLRETGPYLERAAKDNARIRYVLETHFHADFVSGHVDLADKSGATIVYGPHANPEFNAHIATDGEELHVGDCVIRVLHTPGHTLESTTYLLLDENGKEHAIFSGDTLFLGDVGRPDLAQKANHLTMEDLAGMLYDSLNQKIMPLPDDVLVYPAHGAGSACGKNMMKETVDTLGHQKQMNYALRQPDKASFIKAVTEGLSAPPVYFPMNVAMNRTGYAPIDEVMQQGARAIPVSELQPLIDQTGAVVLDVRNADSFSKGFVPQSINIGLDGQFAPWVGAIIGDVKTPLLLVCDEGREQETVMRLARVGFDNVLGFLEGGFNTWLKSGLQYDSVNRISAEQFAGEWKPGSSVLDVRREGEFALGHVAGALNLPLDNIHEWFAKAPTSQPFYIHCAGGYRSMTAASILKRNGCHGFSEVAGGYAAISKTTAASAAI